MAYLVRWAAGRVWWSGRGSAPCTCGLWPVDPAALSLLPALPCFAPAFSRATGRSRDKTRLCSACLPAWEKPCHWKFLCAWLPATVKGTPPLLVHTPAQQCDQADRILLALSVVTPPCKGSARPFLPFPRPRKKKAREVLCTGTSDWRADSAETERFDVSAAACFAVLYSLFAAVPGSRSSLLTHLVLHLAAWHHVFFFVRTEIIPTTTLLTQESNGRSRQEPWSPSFLPGID
jgi:hypothetical protein